MNSKEGLTSYQGFISVEGFNSVQGFNNGGSGLGAELQVNWDMSQGLTAWGSNASASLLALSYLGEDSVRITLDASVASQSGFMSVSGLEVGKSYRVVIRACIGDSAGNQQVGAFNWAANQITNVDNTVYQNFEFDIVATSASGNTNFRVSSGAGGTAGDELYISQCSIREIL